MQNSIMRFVPSFPSRILLLVFVLAVASCSAVRLGYSNGDTVAYWWLNGYVGFSGEQKNWVKGEIDKFFAWHRRTQLPDYANRLARAQLRLQQPLSAAQVQEEFALMRQHAERMVEFALPSLTTLSLSLSAQQIANIERKFAASNEKYRKTYLRATLQERQQARFEKVMKHAEYWFGDFNVAQVKRIRAASDARPMNDERWMTARQQRQNALIGILKKIRSERLGHEEAEALLRGYARDVLANYGHAEGKRFFDASEEGVAHVAAHIVNMTTPQQKAHATRQLQKLIDDGYALAGIRGGEQVSLQTD